MVCAPVSYTHLDVYKRQLIGWCDDIRPFPIGSYYCDGRFVRYEDIADVPAPMQDDMDTVLRNIREKLIAGVEKRLDADAPVGFLLSGGLDSSLVCSCLLYTSSLPAQAAHPRFAGTAAKGAGCTVTPSVIAARCHLPQSCLLYTSRCV